MQLSSLRTSIVPLLLLASLPASSDAGDKLDARARATLSHLRSGVSIASLRERGASVDRAGNLDVFVRGPVTRAQLEAAGARVRTSLPGLHTASIPPSAIDRVTALAGVTAVRGGVRCEPELNVSVPTTGAQLLRSAGPTFAGLNGQGVLIGIVDSGIDYGHGDFDDAAGATRIVSIWDQWEIGLGPPGLPYPYGMEWTSAQIDANTCTQADSLEHGTHVAGIAAGDGSQTGGAVPAHTYAGMAPRADLVVVKTDYLAPDVIDAVNYVFDKAAARGQNAVVNLSLGTHYGSHDGASELEHGIDLLTGPGRIVVKSAGNDRGTHVHAQIFATAGGASATVSVANSAAGRYFVIDGYYSATERLRVRLQTPNGTVIGPLVVKTENAEYPGQQTSNGIVYVRHDSLSPTHKSISIEAYSNASNRSLNGTWTITMLADQLGAPNGEVDFWLHTVSTNLTASFAAGDQPTEELITEPGNAFNVITVGAWVTRASWTSCNGSSSSYPGTPAAGNLATLSSPGPTRDGRQKPDLAAPGVAIASTTSLDIGHSCPASPGFSEMLADGMNHRILQGTSLAAPHVTGAVALLLQKRGALTPAQVRSYLQSHARADGFTGTLPNMTWGYGKLDLGDLIDPTATVLDPNGGEQLHVGEEQGLTWSANDALGSVANVDLQLSRTGPGGPFQNIALAIPNSGSHAWTITGPTTSAGAAYLKVTAHDTNGNAGSDLSDAGFTIAGPLDVGDAPAAAFVLGRVHPNPASGAVDVEFTLARDADVRLEVRDVQGRLVTSLARGRHAAGSHHVTWNDGRGARRIPAGLYFACYETPDGRFVRRLVVTR